VKLGDTKPAPVEPVAKIEHHTRIVNKTNVTQGSRGYSGEGPPGEDL
jgi:hypothetical protein